MPNRYLKRPDGSTFAWTVQAAKRPEMIEINEAEVKRLDDTRTFRSRERVANALAQEEATFDPEHTTEVPGNSSLDNFTKKQLQALALDKFGKKLDPQAKKALMITQIEDLQTDQNLKDAEEQQAADAAEKEKAGAA